MRERSTQLSNRLNVGRMPITVVPDSQLKHDSMFNVQAFKFQVPLVIGGSPVEYSGAASRIQLDYLPVVLDKGCQLAKNSYDCSATVYKLKCGIARRRLW